MVGGYGLLSRQKVKLRGVLAGKAATDRAAGAALRELSDPS